MRRLTTLADAAEAIAVMRVRGAPLIGATAAYGLALAAARGGERCGVAQRRRRNSSPPARRRSTCAGRCNACWRACCRCRRASALAAAWAEAAAICEEDVAQNQAIGQHGLTLLRALAARKSGPLNILTHCNAGWLATVDWGTALAPIYAAAAAGLDVHVWVDETRPRNQQYGR